MSKYDEEKTHVEIGWKEGRVVMNFYGTSVIPSSYIAWTPKEARKVAALLLQVANSAEAS